MTVATALSQLSGARNLALLSQRQNASVRYQYELTHVRVISVVPAGLPQPLFVAYGPRLVQIFRELIARQLVKVLGGAKPA
jgi:hypothetical protein